MTSGCGMEYWLYYCQVASGGGVVLVIVGVIKKMMTK